MASVILKYENETIEQIGIDRVIVTIGRSTENFIQIDNIGVSSFHAKILDEGDRFFIQDLNSLNGTFVNGKEIKTSELHNNDEITIGKHTLIFVNKEERIGLRSGVPKPEKTMMLDTTKHREMSGKTAMHKPMPGDKVGVFKVVAGSAQKTEYVFEGSYGTIGKDKVADIRIKGLFAPKIAAFVQRDGEAYYVNPPEKARPPKINGKPVHKRTKLRESDMLEVGRVKMVFFLREVKQASGNREVAKTGE